MLLDEGECGEEPNRVERTNWIGNEIENPALPYRVN
jgi:hypothetical protein